LGFGVDIDDDHQRFVLVFQTFRQIFLTIDRTIDLMLLLNVNVTLFFAFQNTAKNIQFPFIYSIFKGKKGRSPLSGHWAFLYFIYCSKDTYN
jgi:hypothetical protein